jgi:uncharacterized MAPEG superfamily protein
MEAAAASAEITVLGLSVVLLIVQIMLQGAAGQDRGLKYLAGPRDEQRQSHNVMAGRLDRALRNLLETYPAFIALALALAVTGKTGGIGAAGAWLWLVARVLYVPVYAAGIPMIRTLLWFASLVALAMMLVRLMG